MGTSSYCESPKLTEVTDSTDLLKTATDDRHKEFVHKKKCKYNFFLFQIVLVIVLMFRDVYELLTEIVLVQATT